MKNTILLILIFIFSLGFSQNSTMLVKDKLTNKYSFIEKNLFNNNSMVDFDMPYYVEQFGSELKDYIYIRNHIRYLSDSIGFNNLKGLHQDAVYNYCADTSSYLVPYLMGKGHSYQEAMNMYYLQESHNIRLAGYCYNKRIERDEFVAEIVMYLGKQQGIMFLDAIRNFKSDLEQIALLGTRYDGNNRDAIMDYIESTGGYLDGGLKDYIITDYAISVYGSEEAAREALVNKLHDLIINESWK